MNIDWKAVPGCSGAALAEPHLSTSSSSSSAGGPADYPRAETSVSEPGLMGGKLEHSQVQCVFFSCLFFTNPSVCRVAGELGSFCCVCTSPGTCLGSCEHLLTACLSAHQNRACSHTYLKVQGWHAIMKTALSITLTDRLKRGFNSYSSP